jgi:putative membrane protein
MIFANEGNPMKSKLILIPQFAVAVVALFGTVTLYAQGYGPPPPKPPSATGPASPSPAQQDPYESDNPFFRKKSPSPSARAAANAGAKPLSAKDKNFLSGAASSGGWEIATGRVAEQKAQNSATKEIAARMIADHSKTNKELVDLGNKKGLGISTEGVKAQQISGQDFDKRYLNLVVQDHQEESSVFEKEAKSGDDADIKKWAAKSLPTIKQHLALAKGALSKAK